MKHNVNEKNPSKCYLTEQSIKQNLSRYFGHRTTFLDARLYHVLTNGQKNKRIYMNDLIENLYIPLFESPPIIKASFMFKMLDFDQDGYLHASDLTQTQEIIDELSDFGQELAKLSNYYIQIYLKSRGKIRINDMINLYRYKDLLGDTTQSHKKPIMQQLPAPPSEKKEGELDDDDEESKDGTKKAKVAGETDAFVRFRSCAIEEIKLKIFSEPEKHKDSSVFLASREQIERAQQRERMLMKLQRQQALENNLDQNNAQQTVAIMTSLTSIMMKEGRVQDPFRIKKAVTFMISLNDEDDEENSSADERESKMPEENQ